MPHAAEHARCATDVHEERHGSFLLRSVERVVIDEITNEAPGVGGHDTPPPVVGLAGATRGDQLGAERIHVESGAILGRALEEKNDDGSGGSVGRR